MPAANGAADRRAPRGTTLPEYQHWTRLNSCDSLPCARILAVASLVERIHVSSTAPRRPERRELVGTHPITSFPVVPVNWDKGDLPHRVNSLHARDYWHLVGPHHLGQQSLQINLRRLHALVSEQRLYFVSAAAVGAVPITLPARRVNRLSRSRDTVGQRGAHLFQHRSDGTSRRCHRRCSGCHRRVARAPDTRSCVR